MNRKPIIDIVKVSISNIIKLLSGVLVGLLLPKIIGVSDYGLYKTFTLYSSYVGLLMIGIGDGIYLKYGGKEYESLDKTAFCGYSKLFFLIETFFFVTCALISLLFLKNEYKFIFLSVAIYLLATNVTGYFQIISQVTFRFNELSIRNLIQSFLVGAAIIVLWLINRYADIDINYRCYVLIYLGIIVFTGLWYVFTYRDIIFGYHIKKETFSDIFSFIKIGLPLTVANLCSSLILTLDRQFVNVLFDTDTYAVYAFAYNMLTLITTALSAISTVIYPTLKNTEESKLKTNYPKTVSVILILVFACIAVYFPLEKFIDWFLPKYSNSIPIFRIILPGLAVSSVITIVMHNYYKTLGKNNVFFLKSAIILVLSGVANYFAYLFFKTTSAISIASIIVMIFWYFLIEEFFVRKFKIKSIKNILYMFLMMASFYLITILKIWWFALIIYVFIFIVITVLFYYKDFRDLILYFKKKSLK